MPLKDLLTRTRTNIARDNLAATIERLEQDFERAVAQADALKQEHISLLADRAVANLPLSDAAVDKARAAHEAARAVADAYAQALAAARGRQAAADADAEHAADRARWESALTIADKRQQTIDRLATVTAEFANLYNEVLKLNSELVSALPEARDLDAGLLRSQQIEQLVRLELVRQGPALGWAISYPWKHALQPMASQFAAATRLVHGWAPEA
jgi:hypothetical protein